MSAELVESVLSNLCDGNMGLNPELAAEAPDCFDLNAFPGGCFNLWKKSWYVKLKMWK